MAVNYTINWSDAALKQPFTLYSETTISDACSLALTGYNVLNWGEKLEENLLKLLEHFASNGTPPSNPTIGQLWFNAKTAQLMVFDSKKTWQEIAQRRIDSNSPPTTSTPGTLWYDTLNNKLKVRTNAGAWR